jgi:beta-galactosidase
MVPEGFLMEPEDVGKIVYVRFDGVYMNADFWINGHHLGNHPYGYTSFYYNITEHFLNPPE